MSITLTTGKLVVINGVTQENDDAGSCVSFTVDFIAHTASFVFKIGQRSGANFNVGNYSGLTHLRVNLVTGEWESVDENSVRFVGTIDPGTIAAYLAQFNSDRNAAEVFASAQIMPGTQVAW